MPNLDELMDETLDGMALPHYWMHWTDDGCEGTEHDRIVTGAGTSGKWHYCRDCYVEGTLIEPRDEEEDGKVFRVNAKVILSGMRRLAKQPLDSHWPDHTVPGARMWVLASRGKEDSPEYARLADKYHGDDPIDHWDEDMVDHVIQYGLFGDIVYG